MQKLFKEVNSLDKRCYEKFLLTEDLLMEHAANEMAVYIKEHYSNKNSILIVCGSGNNGADGLALGRLLHKEFEINIYLHSQTKSKMAKIQEQRLKALNINFIENISDCDIVVDCLFGTGLNKKIDDKTIELIKKMNFMDSIKIACDIPSGVNNKGQVDSIAFYADTTITMGALKLSLFSDKAKDYVGKIKVASLGVNREAYETSSDMYLLDKGDLKLPFRDKNNSHKGSYGHLNVVAGCKVGAGVIAAKAAFSFGVGIVSIVCHENLNLPYHIMQTHFISENCTAIAIGMGLGKYEKDEVKKILAKDISLIIDADLFYSELILDVLDKEVVLTPHPKEFCSLLALCNITNINVEELQNNRFKYVELFSNKYPNVVLLLKGTNVIISQNNKLYINTFGTTVLSKGGSGDVLSGLIGSLLAQGYSSLDATLSASLAHSLVALNYKKNNYSLEPEDLIEGIKIL